MLIIYIINKVAISEAIEILITPNKGTKYTIKAKSHLPTYVIDKFLRKVSDIAFLDLRI